MFFKLFNHIFFKKSPQGYPDIFFVCIGTEGRNGPHQLFTLTKESIEQLLQQSELSVLFSGDSLLGCDCKTIGEPVFHTDLWKKIFHKSSYPNGFSQPDQSCDPCDQTASLVVGIISLCGFLVMSVILVTTVVMVNRKPQKRKNKKSSIR